MLKKKLMILFLIGNIVTGVITSNTIMSIAAPVENSSDILHSQVIEYDVLLHKLYEDTSSHYFEFFVKADTMRYKVKSQLVYLKKSRSNIREIKSKFNKISKELDSLRNKEIILMQPLIRDMHRLYYLTDYKGKSSHKLKSIEDWIKNIGYRLPKLLESGKDMPILKNKLYDLSKELEFLIVNTSASNVASDTIDLLMKVKIKSTTLLDTYYNTIDNPFKLKEDEKKCKGKINDLLGEVDAVLSSLNINRSNDLGLQLNTPNNKLHEIKNDIPKNSISQVNFIESENSAASVHPVIQPVSVSSSKLNKPLKKILTLFDTFHKTKKMTPKNSISQVNLLESENKVSSVTPLEIPITPSVKPNINPKKSNPVLKIESVNLRSEENIEKHESNEEDNVTKVNNGNHNSKDNNEESLNSSIESKVLNEVSSSVIIQEKSIEKQIILPETKSSTIKDELSYNKEKTHESENIVISN